MTSSLVEFCNSNGINWFPISLTITQDKKKILNPINHTLYNFQRPKNTDFQNIDADVIKKRQLLLQDESIKQKLNLNTINFH